MISTGVALRSPPPFTRLRGVRTAFRSWIGAPARKRSRVTLAISSSVMPSIGASRIADPPPEIRKSTTSSLERLERWSSSASVPRIVVSSGTGWEASKTRSRGSSTPNPCPCLVRAKLFRPDHREHRTRRWSSARRLCQWQPGARDPGASSGIADQELIPGDRVAYREIGLDGLQRLIVEHPDQRTRSGIDLVHRCRNRAKADARSAGSDDSSSIR